MKGITSFVTRNTLVALIGAGALGLSTQAGFCTGPQWVTWEVSAGGNGHEYLAVSGSAGLTWYQAYFQANQIYGGYLATITSQAENNFVFSLINGPQFFNSYNGAGPAIGGYQYDELAEPAGHWAWVTGEAWSYTSWHPITPNNSPAGQDNLIYYSGIANTPAATWDDVNGNDAGHLGIGIGGFVVERTVVPEPGSLALLGLSGLFFLRRANTKQK